MKTQIGYPPDDSDSSSNIVPFSRLDVGTEKSSLTFSLDQVIRLAITGDDLRSHILSCLNPLAKIAIETLDGSPVITYELKPLGSPDPLRRSTEPKLRFTVDWSPEAIESSVEKLSAGKVVDDFNAS